MSRKLQALALSTMVAAIAGGYAGVSAVSVATAKPSSTPTATAAAVKKKKNAGAAITIKTRTISGLGSVLVNAKGHTLYVFIPDRHKRVTCTGGCATIWPPVKGTKAKGLGGVKQSLLGSDKNPSGGRVITYAGWPLYAYITDTAPGAHAGQAIKLNGGLWYVISPSGKVIKKK